MTTEKRGAVRVAWLKGLYPVQPSAIQHRHGQCPKSLAAAEKASKKSSRTEVQCFSGFGFADLRFEAVGGGGRGGERGKD